MAGHDSSAPGIPIDSWTTDDLDALSAAYDHGPLPGSYAGSPQPTLLHQYVFVVLAGCLESTAPAGVSVYPAVETSLADVPPHLFLVREIEGGSHRTLPVDPVIAVEIRSGKGPIGESTELAAKSTEVFPGDALNEPILWAQYLWRIELVPLVAVVYRRHADGRYTQGTRMTDRIRLDEPWPINIVLRDLLPPSLR